MTTFKSPKGPSVVEARLDQFDDKVTKVHDTYTEFKDFSASTFSKAIKAAFTSVATTAALEDPTNSVGQIIEPVRQLVHGLEALASIHPLIGLAVEALKYAVNLELERRQNDCRTAALIYQMGAMMLNLTELSDSNGKHSAQILEQKLGAVLQDIREVILFTTNQIEVYYKQKLIVKIFRSSKWRDIFTQRATDILELKARLREKLTLTMAVLLAEDHTKLEEIHSVLNESVAALRSQTELITRLLISPRPLTRQEFELTRAIELHGGENCLQDTGAFASILAQSEVIEDTYLVGFDAARSDTASAPMGLGQTNVLHSQSGWGQEGSAATKSGSELNYRRRFEVTPKARKLSLDDEHDTRMPTSSGPSAPRAPVAGDPHPFALGIRTEAARAKEARWAVSIRSAIDADPSVEIMDNWGRFQVIFQSHTQDIKNHIDNHTKMLLEAIHHGHDHDGPHIRIIDPDLRKIWRAERWRGSVAGSALLQAVQDYYFDIYETWPTQNNGKRHRDAWTYPFLSPIYRASILEVIDRDISGFVSIQELNQFVKWKPRDWSLAVWLAYCGAGWQIEAIHYQQQISKALDAMTKFTLELDNLNYAEVATYTHKVNRWIGYLCNPLTPSTDVSTSRPELLNMVATRVIGFERKVKKMLKAISWEFVGRHSIIAVTGELPIERVILPTIFALLEHHYKILQLCSVYNLDPRELNSAWQTINTLLSEVDVRVNQLRDLTTIFLNRPFACGIYAKWPNIIPPDGVLSRNGNIILGRLTLLAINSPASRPLSPELTGSAVLRHPPTPLVPPSLEIIIPTLWYDVRCRPEGATARQGSYSTWLSQSQLDASVTSPPSIIMNLISKLLPWTIVVRPSSQSTFVTVRDFLRALHESLWSPATAAEWQLASAFTHEIAQAYHANQKAAQEALHDTTMPERMAPSRAAGVRRLDWLLHRCFVEGVSRDEAFITSRVLNEEDRKHTWTLLFTADDKHDDYVVRPEVSDEPLEMVRPRYAPLRASSVIRSAGVADFILSSASTQASAVPSFIVPTHGDRGEDGWESESPASDGPVRRFSFSETAVLTERTPTRHNRASLPSTGSTHDVYSALPVPDTSQVTGQGLLGITFD